MTDPMPLCDREAVPFLRGPGSIRDGYLEEITVHEIAHKLQIGLGFRTRSVNFYTLLLEDIFEMDLSLTEDYAASQIPFVKCLWTSEDYFYLSLDPWSESEERPSKRDADFFMARRASLLSVSREPPPGATFR